MTDHDHLAARKLRNESNGNVGLCPLVRKDHCLGS